MQECHSKPWCWGFINQSYCLLTFRFHVHIISKLQDMCCSRLHRKIAPDHTPPITYHQKRNMFPPTSCQLHASLLDASKRDHDPNLNKNDPLPTTGPTGESSRVMPFKSDAPRQSEDCWESDQWLDHSQDGISWCVRKIQQLEHLGSNLGHTKFSIFRIWRIGATMSLQIANFAVCFIRWQRARPVPIGQ